MTGRKAARGLGLVVVGLALLGWLATGFFTVSGGDGAVGVALRFGRVVAERLPPGLYWNLPRPLGRSATVKTAERYTMTIGFRLRDDALGRLPRPEEVQWLSGDSNIVDLRAVLQYIVEDPVAELFGVTEPSGFVLRRVAEAVTTEIVAGMSVDDVLTAGQRRLLDELVRRSNDRLAAYGVGIRVVSASFRSIDPAASVRSAFVEVQSAAADRERIVNEARGYANDLLPRTRGEARSEVLKARSTAAERTSAAAGESARFTQLLAEYRRAPARTRERLYLEALAEVLPRVRLVMSDAGDADGGVSVTLVDRP